jgi:DNA-binding MarR family transcriptional regulator
MLDQQLCFALYSASLAMSKTYKPHLDALGLTYPQYLVMLVLWEQEELSVSDIGERLFLDSGTLTPLLKRLETTGYVARARDAQDERRVRVSLTTEGRQLRKKVNPLPSKVLSATQCSHQEAMRLAKDLHALRKNLKTTD